VVQKLGLVMITYSYNSVAQPISAVDVANSINYATAADYAPQGALAQVLYGSNLTSTLLYNKRLQPCWLYATTGSALATTTLCTAADPGPGNILDLQYGFNLGAGDNGNVMGIANNRDSTRTQAFTYDQVNRLLTGAASTYATNPSHCWGESYVYDNATSGAWGNLTNINSAGSAYTGCTQEGLSVTATANNQLSATGFTYDASGNMLTDAVNTYAWDAESEIKSAAGVNYTYDGDGNRLEKSSGKIYWYGAGTEILDESDLSGNFTNEYVFFGGKRIAMRNVSNGAIYYYAEDFLGSSRTMVQAGQTSVCFDADFYPYGGERDITTTCSQNYKFEGKERDTETNNDDFGARYYTSRLGRWLSSDWSSVPAPVPYANFNNPQTLNLYAMVRDNPETFSDLDGHDPLIDIFDVEDTIDGGFYGWPSAAWHPQPCQFGVGEKQLQTVQNETPAPQPAPTDPQTGKPTPPPVPVPGGPEGTEWKWNPDPQNPRGGTWGPKDWKGPNPPKGSWDDDGHWDIDKGDKSPRDHYDPNGNPITPGTARPGNAPTTMMDRMKSITPRPIIKMGAWGIVGYIIIDEGSRFGFPLRNVVPVP
jgi:RHS repeat-associated protein